MTSGLTTSESVTALAKALAKAQGAMRGAIKDSLNPHYKNRYADLASVWDAIRKPLADHGLSVVQFPEGGADGTVSLTTMLLHESGEWLRASASMVPVQNTPQGVGSCLTYLRRYTLAAVTGVAPEDDDAQEASRPSTSRPEPVKRPAAAPEGFDDWVLDLEATAAEGTEALKTAWKKSQPYMRKYLTDTNAEKWEALKAHADKCNVAVPA